MSKQASTRARPLSTIVLSLLFLSGFASLLYQIVWARQFSLILGSSIQATSTVLAAFMCGLGAGSLWLGRVADRQRNPLFFYGLLEIGIALGGLVVETLIGILPSVYGPLYGIRELPSLFVSARFVLLFLTISIPALLMGGTLPAAARALARWAEPGLASSGVYAVNTIGAALGAFAAGFYFIDWLGVTGTLRTAVLLNLLSGVLGLALSRRRSEGAAIREIAQPSGDDSRPRLALLIYACSGFVALSLEVAWTRSLVFAIGATSFAFSLMVAVVLAGIAMGSLASGLILRRAGAPWFYIQLCQALIVFFAVAAGWLSTDGATAIRDLFLYSEELPWPEKVLIQLAQASALMLLPSMAFGATFPLAAQLYLRANRVGSGVGLLLGLNTLAAIAGSLLTGFVFVPGLGIHRTTLMLGGMSFIVFLIAVDVRKRRLVAASGLTGFAAMVLILGSAPALEPLLSTQKLLFYREGRNGTVSVVEDFSGDRFLLIDHIAVAGTDPIFMTDQKSLAHLPMLLRPESGRVLSVGFGSGGATYSFSRYPQVAQIDVVEIDDAVLEAAPFFESVNGEVLRDPRVRIIHDDARSYLRYAADRYDVITTDCTDLRYRSNAQLYTREFLELARKRLTPGGLVVTWVPLGGLSTTDLKVVIRTFTEVFIHSSAWYMHNYPTHYLLLAGSSSATRPLSAGSTAAAVRRDLAEIQLDEVDKFAAAYLKSHSQLVSFAAGVPINTDDRPYVEFSVPKRGFGNTLPRNLEALFAETANPAELLPASVTLPSHLQARELLLQGHIVYNQALNRYRTAAEFYTRAKRWDPSLEMLIQRTLATSRQRSAEYSKLATDNPGDFRIFNELSLLLEDQGDLDGAERSARRAIELRAREPRLRLNLGRILDRKGLYDDSLREYQAALDLDLSYGDAWNNIGFLHLEQGHYDQAIVAFERATQLTPDSPTVWLNLGLAAHRSGDKTSAQSAYNKALQLDPANADALLNRAVLRLESGQTVEAQMDLSEAVRRRPDSAEIQYNLGLVLEARGDLAEAERAYLAAIDFDNRHVLAHNNLGVLRSRAGRSGDAISIYSRAIGIDPVNPQLRNNLGMEYARIRDFQRAITEYEEAIRLAPRMFEPYANLALIYLRLNRRADAEKYGALAQRINPGFRLP